MLMATTTPPLVRPPISPAGASTSGLTALLNLPPFIAVLLALSVHAAEGATSLQTYPQFLSSQNLPKGPSDWWQDFDGDGASNLLEFGQGTAINSPLTAGNPSPSATGLQVIPTSDPAAIDLTLTRRANVAVHYRLQRYLPTTATWQNLRPGTDFTVIGYAPLAPDREVITLRFPADPRLTPLTLPNLLRLEVSPGSFDADGDGLRSDFDLDDLAGSPAAIPIQWTTFFNLALNQPFHRATIGQRFVVTLPPIDTLPIAGLRGTDRYEITSSIGLAALHSGHLTTAGGTLVLYYLGDLGIISPGSTQNGLTSTNTLISIDNFFSFDPADAPTNPKKFQPADLNHIVFAGQSNAVGYNFNNIGNAGIIHNKQPFNNLTFQNVSVKMAVATSRPVQTSASPAPHSTDSNVLGFEDVELPGWCAPYFLINTALFTNDVRGIWAPGGQRPMHYEHEFYKAALEQQTLFQPLIDTIVAPHHAGTIVAAVCNELTLRTGHRFIGSTTGIGGISLLLSRTGTAKESNYAWFSTVDLSTIDSALAGYWGSAQAANILTQVTNARRISQLEGKTYKVAAICWIQGESDNGNSNYAAQFLVWYDLMNTCIKLITGQSENVAVILDGITYGRHTAFPGGILPVDHQKLKMHLELENIVLSGPRYQYLTPTHYSSQSLASKASVFANAIKTQVFDGEEWDILRYQSHSVTGSTIYVNFIVPVPPLQFSIPKANSVSQAARTVAPINGFRVMQDGVNIATNVEIVASNMVKITCSTSPSSATIEYASTMASANNEIRGILCDSNVEATVFNASDGTPFETRNYAWPFSIKVFSR